MGAHAQDQDSPSGHSSRDRSISTGTSSTPSSTRTSISTGTSAIPYIAGDIHQQTHASPSDIASMSTLPRPPPLTTQSGNNTPSVSRSPSPSPSPSASPSASTGTSASAGTSPPPTSSLSLFISPSPSRSASPCHTPLPRDTAHLDLSSLSPNALAAILRYGSMSEKNAKRTERANAMLEQERARRSAPTTPRNALAPPVFGAGLLSGSGTMTDSHPSHHSHMSISNPCVTSLSLTSSISATSTSTALTTSTSSHLSTTSCDSSPQTISRAVRSHSARSHRHGTTDDTSTPSSIEVRSSAPVRYRSMDTLLQHITGASSSSSSSSSPLSSPPSEVDEIQVLRAERDMWKTKYMEQVAKTEQLQYQLDRLRERGHTGVAYTSTRSMPTSPRGYQTASHVTTTTPSTLHNPNSSSHLAIPPWRQQRAPSSSHDTHQAHFASPIDASCLITPDLTRKSSTPPHPHVTRKPSTPPHPHPHPHPSPLDRVTDDIIPSIPSPVGSHVSRFLSTSKSAPSSSHSSPNTQYKTLQSDRSSSSTSPPTFKITSRTHIQLKPKSRTVSPSMATISVASSSTASN